MVGGSQRPLPPPPTLSPLEFGIKTEECTRCPHGGREDGRRKSCRKSNDQTKAKTNVNFTLVAFSSLWLLNCCVILTLKPLGFRRRLYGNTRRVHSDRGDALSPRRRRVSLDRKGGGRRRGGVQPDRPRPLVSSAFSSAASNTPSSCSP